MKTLKLNENWDLCLDESGKIATATGEYAVAQTAANKIRLFTKDAYFDQTEGIPHFDIELGKTFAVSQSVLTNRIRKAVTSVEGVQDARVELENDNAGRVIGGKIYATTNAGDVVIEI